MKSPRIDLKLQREVVITSDYDPFKLSLRLRNYSLEDRLYIVNQVKARQKAKVKIPEFYAHENIVYPSVTSVEQASSSVTASYKADLVKDGTLVDMTGGLGVDSYFFSRSVSKVIYIEKNRETAEFAIHNFRILKAANIEVKHTDSLNFFKNRGETYNFIYIDPSRRRDKRRVFRLEDSEPNVLEIVPLLLKKAEIIMIKVSPLIDIQYLLFHFKQISQIHIVAVNGECKEVLVLMDEKMDTQNPEIITWSKEKNQKHIFHSTLRENEKECDYSYPLRFIYDPNVSIRKSGLFNAVGNRFKLAKLAPNSHLYTENEIYDTFPGRIFEVVEVKNWKDLTKDKTSRSANIARRNFRLNVNDIREKTGIKEGGETYLFFTTDYDNRAKVLVTKKVHD